MAAVLCASCNGMGRKPGESFKVCDGCVGAGETYQDGDAAALGAEALELEHAIRHHDGNAVAMHWRIAFNVDDAERNRAFMAYSIASAAHARKRLAGVLAELEARKG